MKKIKKAALITGATLVGIMSLNSCKSRAEKEAERERFAKEQLDEQKRREEARADSIYKKGIQIYRDTRDSVIHAMGGDALLEKINSMSEADQKLYELEHMSQMDILKANADTIIAQKTRAYTDEILKLFKKYNLHVNDHFGRRGEQNRPSKEVLANQAYSEYFDYVQLRTMRKHDPEGLRTEVRNEESSLPYYMFGTSESSNNKYYSYNIDWSEYEYGESRQKEIQNAVLEIFAKMNHDIDNTLRAEIKKFAVYYPIFDLSKVPAKYAKFYEDFDPIDHVGEAGGFKFEYVYEPDLYVTRCVRVYDSKLDVNFFGEEGASYKLVKVAEGKGQVVRTDKNGKVAKTPVFSHDVDYMYETDVPAYSLEYTPGKNMGVHISVAEEIWRMKAEKDCKYPDPDGKIAAKCESLRKDTIGFENVQRCLSEIEEVAYSIARKRQNEYRSKNK